MGNDEEKPAEKMPAEKKLLTIDDIKQYAAKLAARMNSLIERNQQLETRAMEYEEYARLRDSESNDLKQELEKKSLQYEDYTNEMTRTNKKIKAENERLKQTNRNYVEIIKKFGADNANTDMERKLVNTYIKAMAGRYEHIEETLKKKEDELKERTEKITGLEKELSDFKEKYSAISVDYDKMKAETNKFGGIIHATDEQIENLRANDKLDGLENENAKYRLKTKSLKKLAAVLGIGLTLALGYIAYNYASHNSTIESILRK